MSAKNNFWDVIKERRTYYQLNKEAPVSDERIEQLVRETILNVPSSFNSQSARLVVLLRKDHDTFWDLVKDALKPLVPAAQFETTEKKLNGFKAAYGTVSISNSLHPISRPKLGPYPATSPPLTTAPDKPTDPLLRRPRAGASAANELPAVRGQIPAVERAHERDAPAGAVGGPRERGLRREPAALQPGRRRCRPGPVEHPCRLEPQGAAGVWREGG